MEKIAIKRHSVESSNIESIGHSFPRRLLEVEFKNGNVYRYKGVSHKDYKRLMDAESKGHEFNKSIKYDRPYKKYQNADGELTGDEYKVLHKKASEILDEMCLMKQRESNIK